jgi:peptide/nickel transport system ATP-binding protein
MSLVDIANLHVRIATRGGEVHPVRGVSIRLEAGQVLGLVGESGCGKSITSMALAGLRPEFASLSADRFTIAGHDMRKAADEDWRRLRRDAVGVVFQNPMKALNPRLLIATQLREAMLPADRAGLRKSYLRAIELLDAVGVDRPAQRLRQYPHELSGGLAQRVVIALALARRPRLLIADEPTTALDVSVQAQILDLLDRLRRDLGLGVLLVTHDLDVVRDRADDVCVMYAGAIVESGRMRDVIEASGHPYTAALVGAMPNMARGRDNPLVGLEGLPPPLIDLPPGCTLLSRCVLRSEACSDAEPALTALARPGHRAACFNNGGRSVVLPRPARATVAAPLADVPLTATPTVEAVSVNKVFGCSGFLRGRDPAAPAAARDVSIAVHEGQSLGIVGESGSGKTTLARMLVGLERPDSGEIRFDGKSVAALGAAGVRRWRREVQFIFQDSTSSLDPRFTVAESIAEPLAATGVPRGEREKIVSRLLYEVGLSTSIASRLPYQLSGGQRQRVGIARALSVNPRLIIADEPVSALDVSVQATILNLLNRLRAERGMSYVIISHDLGVIKYVCSHIAVVQGGQIVERGAVDDVLANPGHSYTRQLIDAVPGGRHHLHPPAPAPVPT